MFAHSGQCRELFDFSVFYLKHPFWLLGEVVNVCFFILFSIFSVGLGCVVPAPAWPLPPPGCDADARPCMLHAPGPAWPHPGHPACSAEADTLPWGAVLLLPLRHAESLSGPSPSAPLGPGSL